tara:strand:+ start:857 stop:1237 length:381 start_codon:yes stop_codon:yes gene_type:complete
MTNNAEYISIDNITKYNDEKQIQELTNVINFQFSILIFILNYIFICKIIPVFPSYLIYLVKQCYMFPLYLVNYRELNNIEEHDQLHRFECILNDNNDEIKEFTKNIDNKLKILENKLDTIEKLIHK